MPVSYTHLDVYKRQHPHNAVREGQTHAVLHHYYDVGAGVGGIAHGQAVAQCRELEGGVDEVVQAGGDATYTGSYIVMMMEYLSLIHI